MKLYLAGPMRNIKDNNRESFRQAREKLRDMSHEVFCPSELTDTLTERQAHPPTLRDMMRIDFVWICDYAEGMVMLPGWPSSKGSLAEIHLAWAIGIPAYNYDQFSRRILREVKVVPTIDS